MSTTISAKFKFAALAAALALGLAACGDDSGSGGKADGGTKPAPKAAAKPAEKPKPKMAAKGLAGDWKVTKADGPDAKGNMNVAYKFDSDGNLLLGGFNKCTYKHTAPDLEFKCGTVTIKWKAEMKDDGKTLVLTNDAKQVLTLTRQ